MNSENKSLLVISVGPKTARPAPPSGLPFRGPLPAKTNEPARSSPKSGLCDPSLKETARLFGATEIEGGFPHSEIPGSKPVRGSPGLIAAYHVLHRLSAPRHPPDTLMALDCSHRQSAFVSGAPDRQIGGERTSARKDQFCFKRIRRSQRSSLDLRLVLERSDVGDKTRAGQTSRFRTTHLAPSGPRPNALPLHNVRYPKGRLRTEPNLPTPLPRRVDAAARRRSRPSKETKLIKSHRKDQDLSPQRSNRRPKRLVEPDGIEPTTSCLQSTRSPN